MNLESLQGGVDALANSIEVYKRNMGTVANERQFAENENGGHEHGLGGDEKLLATLRSGVIQDFETAYELCWKLMQRWLESNISPDIAGGVSRKQFYKIAASHNLIDNVEAWWRFHAARNSTAHIYSRTVAEDVVNKAMEFLPYARAVLETLKKIGEN